MVKIKYLSIISVLAVIMFLFTAAPAQAHPYMYYGGEASPAPEYWSSLEQLAGEFDNILDDMLIGIIGCARWSTDCQGVNSAYWRTVAGQDGPYWDGSDGKSDHGTTNIGAGNPWEYTPKGSGFKFIDSRCLAMLDKILDPNAHTNLPAATVNAIRSAFAANIARARNDTEITIYGVRVSTTGLDKTLNLPTNSHQEIVVFGITLPLDVPSWYRPDSETGFGDPLVESADPRLDDALINLTAAYMTLGGQKMVDYWYSFYGKIIHIIINDLLDDIIAGMLKKGLNDEKVIQELQAVIDAGPENWDLTPDPELYKVDPDELNSKAVCHPWGTTAGVDFEFQVSFKGIKPTVDIRIRITDVNVCTTIRTFADNQLVPSQFTTLPTYLGMQSNQGNLNGDSRTNYTTYYDTFHNSNNLNPSVMEWALREDVLPASIPYLELQPVGQTDPPLNYMTDSWTLSVAFDKGDGFVWTADNLPPTAPRYSYQWKWGNTASDVNTNVTGGGVRVLTINPVNWVGSRFFRCLISDSWGKASTYSNVVEVKVKEPNIVITQQPTVNPTPPILAGGSFTITCDATQTGGTLSYQWQIDRDFGGPGGWENVSDGDSNNVYNVTSAIETNEGSYRCVITSVTFGNTVTTDQVGVTVSAPVPTVALQPVGGSIPIGDDFTFRCNGSILSGTLTYQWEKARVPIGDPIPGPGPVEYLVSEATIDDRGWYRCRITSDDYGTYVYTDEVYLQVGAVSGAVFRVDKMAPRTGGVENGLTWETAFDTIQEGIDAAAAAGGGQVWVAGGPNGGGYVYDEDRPKTWGNFPVTGSLILEDNVALYGGFEGYYGMQEDLLQLRAVRRSVTIIDGSHSRGGTAAAYHVIVLGHETSPSVGIRIDGFDIRGGRATGVPNDYHTWRGGGLYNWQSQPIIENCTFYDNEAAVSGGAIANESFSTTNAKAQIVNCVFHQNKAHRQLDTSSNPMRGGGAIFNNAADVSIVLCTFVGNTIDVVDPPPPVDYGRNSGAIFNYNTTNAMNINSCIFWQNDRGSFEQMCPASNPSCASPAVLNTDFTQTVDPLFDTSQPAHEFNLSNSSPFKDTAYPFGINYDIQGATRPQFTGPDRGAYERVNIDNFIVKCRNITVSLDESGKAIFPASSLFNSVGSQVPGGLWKVLVEGEDTVTLTCSDYPTAYITMTVIDRAGNEKTCTSTVTVKDELRPTAVCKDITVNLNASGQYTLTAAEIDDGSTDNCGTVSLSIPATTYTCANIGTNVVQLTVTDGAGNTDTCLANVTVKDTTPPTVVTKDITVDLDTTGNASITPAQIEDGSTDNCGIDADTFALDRTAFTCADRPTQTVNLTVHDVNGNSASAPATVTVRDVTPPEIFMRGSSYITLVTGIHCYVEEGASWTDVCDGTGEATVGGDTVPSNCPLEETDVGTYVVTYKYTDLGGNAAEEKTRTVNIISNKPPEITLLGANPLTLACGIPYVEPGYTAIDPEDGDLTEEVVVNTSELVVDPESGYIVPGTYEIEYTVTDHDTENPMTTIEIRTLEVEDMDYPTITMIGAEQLAWQLGTPFADPGYAAEDPCWGDVTALTEVVGSVDVNEPGVYVLTYTPKDYSDNAGEPVQREVYVGDFLQIVAQPQNSDAYIDSNTFELSVTFTGGIFIPGYDTYEWLRGSDVVSSGTVIPGENTLALVVDPTAITPGTYMYHAEIKDLAGVHASNQARVRIGNHITLGDPIPDAEVVPGDNFSMTVVATGGIGSLHYQWQKSDGSKAWVNLSDGGNISGSGTATLAFTPFTEEDVGTYQCVITDDYTDVAYSNEVILTKGSGIPVAGTIGITMLTALSALAGVFTLRRRQR